MPLIDSPFLHEGVCWARHQAWPHCQAGMSVVSGEQEIVEWLAKPENLQADSLPPFIESFDAAPYLSSALPLAASVLAINLAHEAVQRAVAATKGVRAKHGLGPVIELTVPTKWLPEACNLLLLMLLWLLSGSL